MIASLRGQVQAIRDDSLVIDVGGVGYKVQVVGSVLDEVTRAGQTIELYTHMSVRENDVALYGFRSIEEQDLFSLLLRVRGVGPRTALATLSTFSPKGLRSAIVQGDASVLTRIPGIGRKTAQRLMLDLKDSIGMPLEPWGAAGLGEEDADVISALTSLGYSLTEAQGALAAVPEDAHEVDERVLAALRFLGGG